MKLSSYLSLSRHGVYYFRWPVPERENEARTTVRISLRTRCPNRAGDLARHLASCGRLIRSDEALVRVRRDEIRERVKDYFREQLKQYLERLDRYGLSKNALADAREEMLDHDSMVELESVHPQYLPIARFKRKMDISDADWDASLPQIAIELRKGRRDMLKRVLEAAERFERYTYEIGPEVAEAPPPSASAPLGRAIDDFMAEHSRQWPETTAKQVQSYLNLLLEFFGSERLLGTISKQDASQIKKALQALPTNRNTKPELKGLSLRELVELKGFKTLSSKTINSHIDAFRRFFEWAERHGHAPYKLFEGMKMPKVREGDVERRPFSRAQAQTILSELTKVQSGIVRKESHKWGALLGLFTGARLNEICQLEIADIQRKGDIWYLDITDEGNNKKRVKAKASRRKVPVHSELIRLGFLEFVKSRQCHSRLFPDFSYTANGGYGRNLGRWFNDRFLPSLEMKEPGLVFHSLRHTIVTRLGQTGVPEPIYQCLVGHAREGVTQEVYLREGFALEQLRDAIEKYEV